MAFSYEGSIGGRPGNIFNVGIGNKGRTKTAYTQWGAPIQVPFDQPLTRWQPNTGYAGDFAFDAPPPAPGGWTTEKLARETPDALKAIFDYHAAQQPRQFQGGGSAGARASMQPLTRDAYDPQALAGQASRLRREEAEHLSGLRGREFDRRTGIIKGAYGDAPAEVTYEGPIGSQEEAARAASFARAKEMAAMNARASMTALEDVAAESGQYGSTIQAARGGEIIGGARADVHDFLREQLTSDTERAREVANMRYQGGVTQRGQNMSRQQALLALLSSGGLY